MRKKRFLLILVLIFSVVFSFGVFAAEVEDIPDITIPEEITKYMPDGLSEISSENFSSFFTVNSAFETLGKIFSDVFPEAMSAFFYAFGACYNIGCDRSAQRFGGVGFSFLCFELCFNTCFGICIFYVYKDFV